MLFGKRKEEVTRQKYKESKYPVPNPGMGWYRPFLFDLREEIDEFLLSTVIVEQERLCLLEIKLAGYQNGPISHEGIFHLEQILDYFHEQKKDIMLRFAYDFEGKAFEKEPLSLKQVLQHMNQIAQVVKPFEKEILLYQGLFVGSWGEMHSSRFITDLSILKLYDEFRKCFGKEACLALRTIKYLALIESARGRDDKLTLFDDAIYGSDTDMGTFSEGRKAEELDMFISNRKCPVGGEVLCGEERITKEIQAYHLTYLNSQYDKNAILEWERNGVLEEVNRRLGYRFLIVGLNASNSGMHTYMKIELLNVGGGICPYELTMSIEMGGNTYKTSFMGSDLMPTKIEEIVIDLGRDISGLRDSELSLVRRFDGAPIHFANSGLRKLDKIPFKALWEK
ncbi:MAG: DUF4874 domain-containing protein [Lachnospiraceae bacterium]|nr:DUF4874 domain-containing protein [Lachnospiraceae bacterium]